MDIITIIILTGITNATFALYSWQQVSNPESHLACKDWAQAHGIKAVSFVLYAIALTQGSDDLRLIANLLILLGCWAEAYAYNKLAGSKVQASLLVAGFLVTAFVFTFFHAASGSGPNHTMIVTASFLILMPLSANILALHKLQRKHAESLFPKVLIAVNATILGLCLIRGLLAINNPDYVITGDFTSNQLFIFATFISGLGNGIGFIGFLKEQSDRKLRARAEKDFLTGIYNRQGFEKIAAKQLSLGQKFTLHFIDIDKFKAINDHFGHATGDRILQCFAALLHQLQLEHNAIAGRLGGEEFGLILPHHESLNDLDIIQKIRVEFAHQSYEIIGSEVTFSVGRCDSDYANSVQSLLQRADELQYQDKRSHSVRT